MKAQLVVPVVKGKVQLGCLPEERVMHQPIEVQLKIDFKTPPETCETDEIKDTPCYAEISDLLTQRFSSKEFKTIEHLALLCFEDIRTYLQKYKTVSELFLEINKLHPPIDTITQGCQFSLQSEV